MTVPSLPSSTAVRAGDRDREKAASLLSTALTHGYLDMAEFDRRLQVVWDAHTEPDLTAVTADLPVVALRRHDPRRHAARRAAARRGMQAHLAAYLLMVAVVLAVWLAVGIGSGAWYFWPVWPILGAGIGVVSHVIPVRHALARGTLPALPPFPFPAAGCGRPRRRRW